MKSMVEDEPEAKQEYLDKLETKNEVCFKIGKELSKLHEKEIIHGDLTTSNLILKDKKIYFIRSPPWEESPFGEGGVGGF